jgi:hypothetical protein
MRKPGWVRMAKASSERLEMMTKYQDKGRRLPLWRPAGAPFVVFLFKSLYKNQLILINTLYIQPCEIGYASGLRKSKNSLSPNCEALKMLARILLYVIYIDRVLMSLNSLIAGSQFFHLKFIKQFLIIVHSLG